METSREAARTAIENTIAQLKKVVPSVSLDAPLTLHAVTPYSQTMQSTFGREVPYQQPSQIGLTSLSLSLSSAALVRGITRCSSLVDGTISPCFLCFIKA